MNSDLVIMGLPASGKTTYLAALWHQMEAGDTDCRLKLDVWEGDLSYLTGIAGRWRTFEAVKRTSQTGDANVSVRIVDTRTGAKAKAFFADIAGERFDAQIELRRCRRTFFDNAEANDGILFFVSAENKQDSLSINEFNSFMPSGDVELPDDADAAPAETTEASARRATVTEWGPKHTPVQVRIVQMLSDLHRHPFTARPRRLALIVSAWDIVAGSGISPARWIANEMPLLAQFLATNAESFTTRTYGVSAQGLDLNDKAAVAEAAKGDSSRRIILVDGTDVGNDITTPLVWLMSQGEPSP